MEELTPAVVALGMFDGVHLGHRALLGRAVEQAKALHAEPAVFTFSNHPMDVLGGSVKLLSGMKERNAMIRSLGIEELISEPFTCALAALTPEAFVDLLQARWNVRALIAGYNYTFGDHGLGTPETLERLGRERGFDVLVVPPVLYEGEPVSSTRAREAVERGDMALAEALLARKYSLSGRVVRNKRIGRRIGFPTANIDADPRRVLPPNGVYATFAYVGGSAYRAVTNIGNNPTVQGEKLTIETYILDFDSDIYGEELTVAFRSFLRGEIDFDSMEALKEQIERDVLQASALR
ncbi:MAG TPA: bifunctional riboflavin kinase/FAD synthetase [Feifaniaceae bacterium]|nr:bifunctional riboflavin kinase/FAD synthetase [Feifaniaceae bacterium]